MDQNTCKKCSVKGDKPDLCMDHLMQQQVQMTEEKCRHFKRNKGIWDYLGPNTTAYTGASILGVTVGTITAPLIGLPVIAHTAILKLGAGFFGGCMSIVENKEKDKAKKDST